MLQVYTSEARDEWRSLYLAASFMYVSWSWLYTKNESNRVGLANGTLERERSVDSQPRYLCLALCFPTFLLNVFLTSAKPTIRCSEGRERKRKEMKPMRQMPVSRFQLITHHSSMSMMSRPKQPTLLHGNLGQIITATIRAPQPCS